MLQSERLLTFTQAARTLPPIEGRRLHPSTVWRWASKGTKGVRLEALRLGGRWLTSAEALERFGVALADRTRADLESNRDDIPMSPVADKQIREVEIRKAERQLDRAGIRG